MISKKMIKSNNKCNPCKDLVFFRFPSRKSKGGREIPFTNMNTNTKYICQ